MDKSSESAPAPFGRRRVGRDVGGAEGAPSPSDPLRDVRTERAGSLRWAVQTVFAAGLVAILAVHSLSRLTEPGATSIRIADNRGPVSDPETTGSLASPSAATARSVRLDPCSVATASPRH